MKNLGIYIHIPFCKRKCDYCDFNSYSNKENLVERYIECLKKEINEVAEGINYQKEIGLNDGISIGTIYIGGGTPSFINSKFIAELINKIKEYFNVLENAEITIEINPGTVDKEKLEDYYASGINRCSIGLQASNNKLLETIGRIHKLEDFKETYKLAKQVRISKHKH